MGDNRYLGARASSRFVRAFRSQRFFFLMGDIKNIIKIGRRFFLALKIFPSEQTECLWDTQSVKGSLGHIQTFIFAESIH